MKQINLMNLIKNIKQKNLYIQLKPKTVMQKVSICNFKIIPNNIIKYDKSNKISKFVYKLNNILYKIILTNNE